MDLFGYLIERKISLDMTLVDSNRRKYDLEQYDAIARQGRGDVRSHALPQERQCIAVLDDFGTTFKYLEVHTNLSSTS